MCFANLVYPHFFKSFVIIIIIIKFIFSLLIHLQRRYHNIYIILTVERRSERKPKLSTMVVVPPEKVNKMLTSKKLKKTSIYNIMIPYRVSAVHV